MKNQFKRHVEDLQEKIIAQLQALDPTLSICEDMWSRLDFIGQPGGGGRTRAFKGKIFEGGGVNISNIWGKVDPTFAQGLKGKSDQIWASGISIIIHPRNPRIPTIHGNFRMIENGAAVWFGGGVDLTPYYPYPKDFHYFHQVWRETLSPYGVYEEMKQRCDEYFVNHHRGGEMRGIGGFFFDHYNSGNLARDWAMVKHFSLQFIRSYFPLVQKRKEEQYSEEDVDFQLHRRGRYVEFNLLHDRGTLFGLRTNGRVDSILISLPPRCCYSYCYRPKAGSCHEQMMDYYRPRQWS